MVRLLVVLLLLGASTVPAFAAPILFTDRAAFISAANVDVFAPFNTFTSTTVQEFCPQPVWPHSCYGVADGVLSVSQAGTQPMSPPTGGLLGFRPIDNEVTLSLADGAKFLSIGFDLVSAIGAFQFLQLSAFPVSEFSGTDSTRVYPTTDFIGLLFDEPMRGLKIASNASGGAFSDLRPIVIDNVALNHNDTVSVVPEPATAALMLAGLALVAIRRQRQGRGRDETRTPG